MAISIDVQNVLTVAEISQYLSQRDIFNNINRGNGDVNSNYAMLLHFVREGVQFAYEQDEEDETLNLTARYLYSLCGRYIMEAQTISTEESCSVPIILTQPASQTAEDGDDVTFSVLAYSLATMTYQWYKNGVAMSGKTSSVLTLENISDSDAASYTVVVTTSCGTATSSAAVLTNDTPVVSALNYFSTNETGTPPTAEEIVAGTENEDDPLTDVTMYWGAVPASPVYYWLAIANTGEDALKNKWYESVLNQGNMGSESDLFGAPTTVDVDGQEYYVWITQYATQFVDNDYVFSKV